MANAGTPLLWAGILHLLIGNLLLGVIEGLLLAWWFRAPRQRSIWMLVAANYLSSFLGAYVVLQPMRGIPGITIENAGTWHLVLLLVALLLTLVVEWPFFWLALRGQRGSLVRSLRAVGLVHCLTYPLIVILYWLTSGPTMMTRLKVVPGAEIVPADQSWFLYYIEPEGERIMRSRLDGRGLEPVKAIPAGGPNDRLFVREREGGDFDLYLHRENRDRSKISEDLVRESFADAAAIDHHMQEDPTDVKGTWMNFGPVPSLVESSPWQFTTGFWASWGIRGETSPAGEQLWFAQETPLTQWVARNAVELEAGVVLFQLGPDQICLLDARNRKVALLARGLGPVAVKSE